MKKSILLTAFVMASTLKPCAEIELPVMHLPSGDTQIVVSWNFIGEQRQYESNVFETEKHLSLECFVNGDIDDGLIFYSREQTCVTETDLFQSHTVGADLFANYDEFFTHFEISF